MLYVIIIAAVVVVVMLKKKPAAGSGGSGGSGGTGGTGGTGTQGDITLPIGTNLYDDKDGQMVLWGSLASPITITSLPDATRPEYRFFNWTKSLQPPRRK